MSEGCITIGGWSRKVHLQLLKSQTQISRATSEGQAWRGSLLRAAQVRSSQGHQLGKEGKEAGLCRALQADQVECTEKILTLTHKQCRRCSVELELHYCLLPLQLRRPAASMGELQAAAGDLLLS